MKEVVQFDVVGERRINCSRCEARIGDGLRRLSGVDNVEANVETQRVSVTIDTSQVSAEKVRTELAALGFQAA